MKTKALVLLFCFSSGVASAADWLPVSSSDRADYFGLAGSFKVTTNKAGDEIAVMTGKNDNKADRTVTLEKLYVRVRDCKAQQGKVVALTMEGDFKYDFDFIFGAGNVGSTKAEFICGVYDHLNKKGL